MDIDVHRIFAFGYTGIPYAFHKPIITPTDIESWAKTASYVLTYVTYASGYSDDIARINKVLPTTGAASRVVQGVANIATTINIVAHPNLANMLNHYIATHHNEAIELHFKVNLEFSARVSMLNMFTLAGAKALLRSEPTVIPTLIESAENLLLYTAPFSYTPIAIHEADRNYGTVLGYVELLSSFVKHTHKVRSCKPYNKASGRYGKANTIIDSSTGKPMKFYGV